MVTQLTKCLYISPHFMPQQGVNYYPLLIHEDTETLYPRAHSESALLFPTCYRHPRLRPAAMSKPHLDLRILRFELLSPQVLLVVEEPIVNDLGQLSAHLGTRGVVACAVPPRVPTHIRWCLGDNEDLVHIPVINLIVRVLIRPGGEGVLPPIHLLQLLVKQEI